MRSLVALPRLTAPPVVLALLALVLADCELAPPSVAPPPASGPAAPSTDASTGPSTGASTGPTAAPSARSTPGPVAGLPDAPPPAHGSAQLPGGATIADVAARVTPSVVTVLSRRGGPPSRFLGAPSGEQGAGLGSGVIVDADGIVVTNHHVIEQADAILVALPDGRRLPARVVGSDPPSDLAVLRLDGRGAGFTPPLVPIEVADSSKLRIGDLVLAVGNPFGIGQTVTMGIISAVGRANMGLTEYEDFIQTDAAINPGNSGGALVDMNGRLVGINTAIITGSGGSQGIGFAIPSAMAMQIKDALVKDGRVVRGWLGVAIQDVDEDLARELRLPARKGVLITDVEPDGPAAKAGLARGDLVVSIDGAATTSSAQLKNHVAMAGRGATITLGVVRDGQERSVTVVLGQLPETQAAGPVAEEGPFGGVTVATLDDEVRQALRLPRSMRGVVVTAGNDVFEKGDVILEIDRAPVHDVAAFREAARKAGPRSLVLVHRRGTTAYLLVTPR